MGELRITGTAEREVTYDRITVDISFSAWEESVSEGLRKVMEQCEEFLYVMDNRGVPREWIRFEEDLMAGEHDDDDYEVCVSRNIQVTMPMDMEMLNWMLGMIGERGYDADIGYSYSLSDPGSVHDQLLKEAIADAERKADIVAWSLHKEITGILSVEPGTSGARIAGNDIYTEMPAAGGCSLEYSGAMGKPVTRERETVEIVWAIE